MDLTEIVHFDNTQRHPWELARYVVIRDYVETILGTTDSHRHLTVLDIGCGDAYLVHRLAHDFPEIQFYGVDINFSAELLHQIRDNVKVPNLSINQKLEDLTLPVGSVDLVLLLDVLEHIEDEIGFMHSLPNYPFIHQETTFLITVPAYQPLFTTHDHILEHYRRYSNRTLRRRLSAAGYTTTFERYFFMTLIPPRIIQLVKERLSAPTMTSVSDLAAWKGGSVMTSLIKNVLVMDYKLGGLFKKIGIRLPGLSNLAICRRSV